MVITFGFIFALIVGVFADDLNCSFSNVTADGFITVNNSAQYSSSFSLEYDLSGERKTELTDSFQPGVRKTIIIPSSAKNIVFNLQYYWLPNNLSVILTEAFCQPVQKCYSISGSNLDPKLEKVPC